MPRACARGLRFWTGCLLPLGGRHPVFGFSGLRTPLLRIVAAPRASNRVLGGSRARWLSRVLFCRETSPSGMRRGSRSIRVLIRLGLGWGTPVGSLVHWPAAQWADSRRPRSLRYRNAPLMRLRHSCRRATLFGVATVVRVNPPGFPGAGGGIRGWMPGRARRRLCVRSHRDDGDVALPARCRATKDVAPPSKYAAPPRMPNYQRCRTTKDVGECRGFLGKAGESATFSYERSAMPGWDHEPMGTTPVKTQHPGDDAAPVTSRQASAAGLQMSSPLEQVRRPTI